MKRILYLIILTVLIIPSSASAQTTVKGRVVNERGEAVEYVSIGFEDDSVGVISDARGHFVLSIPSGRKNDLSFSHVSYQTQTVPFPVYSQTGELTVKLKDKVVELSEVVIGKKSKPHTLSGKSWVSFGDAGYIINGSDKNNHEWGPIFSNRKDYVLSNILIAVDECRFEQCTLSFNVYEIRDRQFVNILNKPIYQVVSSADNGKLLDVTPSENIVLKGKQKYCICLSVVDVKGKGAIYFPLTFKSSYARNTVKGKRRKLPACPAIMVKGYEMSEE